MGRPPDKERGPANRPSTSTRCAPEQTSHTETTAREHQPAATLSAIHGGPRRAAHWLRRLLDSEPYRRGVARAEADRANVSDAETVRVTLDRGGYADRDEVDWHLPCQRPVDRCECEAVRP